MTEPLDPWCDTPDPAGCAIINAIAKGNLMRLCHDGEGNLYFYWSPGAPSQLGKLARDIGKIDFTDPVIAEYESLPELKPDRSIGGLSPQQLRDLEDRFQGP
ncbi:MAG: hypothetical protein RIB60_06150 [Phycisphaerales bacterium]